MKFKFEKYRYLCIQIFEALFSVIRSAGSQNLQKTAFSHCRLALGSAGCLFVTMANMPNTQENGFWLHPSDPISHCVPCNTFGEQREIYEWIRLFFKPPWKQKSKICLLHSKTERRIHSKTAIFNRPIQGGLAHQKCYARVQPGHSVRGKEVQIALSQLKCFAFMQNYFSICTIIIYAFVQKLFLYLCQREGEREVQIALSGPIFPSLGRWNTNMAIKFVFLMYFLGAFLLSKLLRKHVSHVCIFSLGGVQCCSLQMFRFRSFSLIDIHGLRYIVFFFIFIATLSGTQEHSFVKE